MIKNIMWTKNLKLSSHKGSKGIIRNLKKMILLTPQSKINQVQNLMEAQMMIKERNVQIQKRTISEIKCLPELQPKKKTGCIKKRKRKLKGET